LPGHCPSHGELQLVALGAGIPDPTIVNYNVARYLIAQ
jgi:hypothetical protein